MKTLKYISAQPDELYFAWQIEVMLDNFLSYNINGEDIHVLVAIDKSPSIWWHKLIEKYPSVGFYFYKDERSHKQYAPSIQPYITAKHFERFPELTDEVIFYHDSDMIFTREPIFESLLEGDTWYVSHTRSDYLSSKYIFSKGEGVLEGMCGVLDISPDIVKSQDSYVGGAQYIMKNVTPSYWNLVRYYSEDLYFYLNSLDSDIQKWTAGMWAILWTSWKQEQDIRVHPSLGFAWATDTWPKWDIYGIYHNAGVVKEHDGKLFNKSDYRGETPYSDYTSFDPQFCSFKYYQEVIKTGRNTCLIDKGPDMEILLNECKSIFISV